MHVELVLSLGVLLPAAGAEAPVRGNSALEPPRERFIPQDSPVFREVSPEILGSIERGLKWLSRNQTSRGEYGSGAAPVATTALSGMAFLLGGHVPGRSKYGENVKSALTFILRHGKRSGYINEGGIRGSGGSGMHGHGYATMFLAQCYGMTGEMPDFETETLKERLTQAIRVIEQSQSRNGGWYYVPGSSSDEGSVTVTQVQALRAARNAGISVDIRTIRKAIDYINRSTGANGRTNYRLGTQRSTFALTAAGMSVLCFLGSYDNPKLKKGLQYILASKESLRAQRSGRVSFGNWYFYGSYYATLACYHGGDATWKEWWPAISQDLVRQQDSDGSWKNGESSRYGNAFGTSLALHILQIPFRFSPLYQRGSD